MWILIRILFALAGRSVSQFLFKRKLNTQDLVHPSGFTYRHETFKGKYGKVISQAIEFEATNKSYVHFRGENFFSRLLKRTGFATELQTGNKLFDDLIFVACDDTEAISFFQKNKTAQDAVLKIWEQGWTDLLTDGRSGRVRIKGKADALLNEDILNCFITLQKNLNQVPQNPWYQDTDSLKIIVFETIAYSALGYSLASYLELIFSDTLGLINPWSLLLKGFLLGAALFMTWFVAALVLLKGTSRLVVLITDFLFIAVVCIFISGPQVMTDLNVALDPSGAQITQAYLTEKFSKTTGTGKSRRTQFYFRLALHDNPFHLPQTFQVSPWIHWKFEKGQTLDFFIFQGFFNAPYVNSIELSQTAWKSSQTLSAPQAAVPVKAESELIEALQWTQSQTPPQAEAAANSKVIIEKYSRTQVKSNEPTINGLKEGLAQYWHPNGQLYAKIPWKNDLKHGRFQLYRDDGTLESDFTYKAGKPHGVMRWFDRNQKMTHNLIYVDGEVQNLKPEKAAELIQKYWK